MNFSARKVRNVSRKLGCAIKMMTAQINLMKEIAVMSSLKCI